MDAISSIQSRIAEIQTRIASFEHATTAGAVLGSTSTTSTPASTSASTSASASGFGATLAAEQARTVGSTSAVASGRSALNAKGVPLAYLKYGNGKVPSAELSTISGTTAQVWPNAARSFEAMRSAAAADGVTIGITDSYRSYAAQVDVAARKGLYSQGGLAAVPGTSNHGWGMALDLRLDGTAQSWMQQNAARYGYVDDTPRESWHWHYEPTT